MATISAGQGTALGLPSPSSSPAVISLGPARITLPIGLARDGLSLACVLAVCLPLWLVPIWRYTIPIGFGGLYAQMADQIAANGYALPTTVPFYGPGGIPFAYPPLALYLMAIAIHALHISAFTYMRLMPVAFLALAAFPTYLLVREVTGSRLKATIATVLIGLSPDLLSFHMGAGGVVRGLGSLFMVAGLFAAWKALRGGGLAWIGGAGVLFGLSLLTHPSNAGFFALSVAVFVVVGPNRIRSLVPAALIALVGLVVSAPWWLTILQRDGPDVFRLAAATPHASRVSLSVQGLVSLAAHSALLDFPTLWHSLSIVYVLAIFGALFCLARGQWLLPVWLAASVALAPDPWRFVMLVGGMTAATLVVDVATMLQRGAGDAPVDYALRRQWPALLAAALLVIQVGSEDLWWPRQVTPMVNRAEVAMGAWVQEHTPPTSRILVLPRQQPEASDKSADSLEWFAYLTQRTATVGFWGSEWVGGRGDQALMVLKLLECRQAQSLACVDGVDQQAGAADYLVVLAPLSVPELQGAIAASGRWSIAFENNGVTVWQRVGRDSVASGEAG